MQAQIIDVLTHCTSTLKVELPIQIRWIRVQKHRLENVLNYKSTQFVSQRLAHQYVIISPSLCHGGALRHCYSNCFWSTVHLLSDGLFALLPKIDAHFYHLMCLLKRSSIGMEHLSVWYASPTVINYALINPIQITFTGLDFVSIAWWSLAHSKIWCIYHSPNNTRHCGLIRVGSTWEQRCSKIKN